MNLTKGLSNLRSRTLAFLALAAAICFTAVACSGGAESQATGGVKPELVADYIHTALASDRTAYTKHVVNRAKKLEGKPKEDGVLEVEATEGWENSGGIPLPAQMFRLGSEIASEEQSAFTYNLISTWYINDAQGPKSEFEKKAIAEVEKTGEPYKEYQEVSGKKYFSALYPDKAVAEACVTCHNTHPIHKERYPDKVFKLDDVMGGVMINIPLDGA